MRTGLKPQNANVVPTQCVCDKEALLTEGEGTSKNYLLDLFPSTNLQ